MRRADQKIETMRRLEPFAATSWTEVLALAAAFDLSEAAPGDVLCGGPANRWWFVIASGTARVCSGYDVVTWLGAGDTFGAEDAGPVVALTPVTVLSTDRRRLAHLVASHPGLCGALAAELARRAVPEPAPARVFVPAA